MQTNRLNRRAFVTATAATSAIAVGLFATSAPATFAAQSATPIPVTPLGFASTRLRTLTSASARDQVTAAVLSDFADQVKPLAGYEGYILGDVIDDPTKQVAITVLQNADQADAFNTTAATFVASVADLVDANATVTWAGDVLIDAGPSAAPAATPAASPAATPLPAATPIVTNSEGYLAVRIHTSKPGTDPRDIIPQIISGFLPIVTGLPGFKGYLWYPIDGGFVAISLYDSVASANASNAAAQDWAVANVSDYTDGNPQIINANVVYIDLPIIPGL